MVLARYHYYNSVIFHRVIEGFVCQGGDPTGTGRGDPGYRFADELPQPGRYELGSVAMVDGLFQVAEAVRGQTGERLQCLSGTPPLSPSPSRVPARLKALRIRMMLPLLSRFINSRHAARSASRRH